MKQKATFKTVLAISAILLAVLPFAAAANSFLTNVFNHAWWYKPIETYVVPWEAKMVSAAIYPMGITTRINVGPSQFAFYMIKDKGILPVDLAWNCLGWQSLLLLIVSLVVGLRGSFSLMSRIECVVFGFFGTIVVNVFRMSFVAAGIYYVNEIFARVVHDYVAAFFTLIWLIFFWWFSYKYILEDKVNIDQDRDIKV